jgi:hypothetical protein
LGEHRHWVHSMLSEERVLRLKEVWVTGYWIELVPLPAPSSPALLFFLLPLCA